MGAMRRTALAVLAAVALPAVAAADTSNTSAIAQLMVLESGDKNYRSFHGAVWLEYVVTTVKDKQYRCITGFSISKT